MMIIALLLFIPQCLNLAIGLGFLFWYCRKGRDFMIESALVRPAISVVSSVKGISAGIEDGIRCLWNQDYKGEIEIVLVIEELSDPALPLIYKLKKELETTLALQGTNPKRRIRVLTGRRYDGANPRNRKMRYAFDEAENDWILWHAIDTTFSPRYLDSCVSLTKNSPRVYVSGFPINHHSDNFGARLETTSLNLEVSRFFLLTMNSTTKGPIYGGAIFAHRRLFKKSSALPLIPWRLTEDVIFAQNFARIGAVRKISPWPVLVRQSEQTFTAFCNRQVRWMMIARHHMKIEFFLGLLGFITPLTWTIAVIAKSWPIFELGVAYIFMRILLALTTQIAMRTPRSDWASVLLLPIYDFLVPGFWLLAILKRDVVWCGDVMTVGPGGELRVSKPVLNFRRLQDAGSRLRI